MKVKNQDIFFCLARLPLLVLYVSFFIVQLFYNFDIANRFADTADISIHNKNQETVKGTAAPAEKKICFRLNKRYHPQPAITCNVIIITPVVCCVTSKLHVHYSSEFIPSSGAPCYSLRGPPAVV